MADEEGYKISMKVNYSSIWKFSSVLSSKNGQPSSMLLKSLAMGT
jgi:hypothetical protein